MFCILKKQSSSLSPVSLSIILCTRKSSLEAQRITFISLPSQISKNLHSLSSQTLISHRSCHSLIIHCLFTLSYILYFTSLINDFGTFANLSHLHGPTPSLRCLSCVPDLAQTVSQITRRRSPPPLHRPEGIGGRRRTRSSPRKSKTL